MKHRASARFWRSYHELPTDIQRQADACFRVLKNDPRHPSLDFKKVGRFWSARIGMHHRAVAVERGEDLVWFWIGRHDEYERLIR